MDRLWATTTAALYLLTIWGSLTASAQSLAPLNYNPPASLSSLPLKQSSNKQIIGSASAPVLNQPATTQAAPAQAAKLPGKLRSGKKEPYSQEKQIQANPTPIGSSSVLPIEQQLFPAPLPADLPDAAITIPQPILKALISVDRRLSPLRLEASFSEQVALRDILLVAMKDNLDILDTHATAEIRKYSYLQSLSKFLPDALVGYSLIGAHGDIKTPGAMFGGSQGVTTLRINSPFTIANAGFRYKAYQGGAVVFGAIQHKHQLRAAREQLAGTLNDTLLKAAQSYYNLLLNEALLQIRVKAVETSEEQLNQNTNLEANGLATNLDILQARTQLARDRQNLLEQQSARRVAAIQLAHTLNISLAQDLVCAERTIRKARLISRDLSISNLLNTAVDHRPELKQYEELRKAGGCPVFS